MNSSVEEWAKAINDCNANVLKLDSIKGEIESEADHEERAKRAEDAGVFDYFSIYNIIKSKPKKFQVYFAMQTKRGIEHFISSIKTIRGEEYKVYKFYSRTRINRIITRTKLRQKI